MPTPMMNDASIRPSSRKTLVCSTFISSGWRAEASMYLAAMMSPPMQAPMAPRPLVNPQAIATYATFVISSLQCERVRSMVFVRLADVNQGQHHENEGLQQHDQDVKNRPSRAGKEMQPDPQQRCAASEARNQEEDQLAGVHVSVQSPAVRERLRGTFDHVKA